MEKEPKNEKPKDMATALDCAIRDYENKEGGFEIGNAKYFNYMSNEAWNEFYRNINPEHKRQYGTGAGGELKAGQYPPKMASFGSSSRLIYELSKDVKGFIFEERLDTRVGGIANLDGLLRRCNEYIYVEAKRREIYGASHERQEIKSIYVPVYEKLKSSQFSYNLEDIEVTAKQEETKKITLYVNGEPVKYFDLKQLICHFLGITYDIAKHSVKNAKVTFLYLLYNPNEVEDKIDEKYRKKVVDRYKVVENFVRDNISVFKSIFDAVLQYQTKTHKLEKPNIDFDFKLVDQKDYINKLI
jgi:hypothetical protein